MQTTTSPAQHDLVELVAVAEFLIRSGQHRAAVVATDQLADALLAHNQRLARRRTPDNDRRRRDTLRLWAEVRLLSSRLRVGPVRRPPALRAKVDALFAADTTRSA